MTRRTVGLDRRRFRTGRRGPLPPRSADEVRENQRGAGQDRGEAHDGGHHPTDRKTGADFDAGGARSLRYQRKRRRPTQRLQASRKRSRRILGRSFTHFSCVVVVESLSLLLSSSHYSCFSRRGWGARLLWCVSSREALVICHCTG